MENDSYPELIDLCNQMNPKGGYALIVSENNGERVYCKHKLSRDDIELLKEPETGDFYKKLRIDDWPFVVINCMVSPKKRTVLIEVKHSGPM